jgi:hypothetical protein
MAINPSHATTRQVLLAVDEVPDPHDSDLGMAGKRVDRRLKGLAHASPTAMWDCPRDGLHFGVVRPLQLSLYELNERRNVTAAKSPINRLDGL